MAQSRSLSGKHKRWGELEDKKEDEKEIGLRKGGGEKKGTGKLQRWTGETPRKGEWRLSPSSWICREREEEGSGESRK